MIAPLAFPRDGIVYICSVYDRPPSTFVSPANSADWDDREDADDDQDDEDIEMPFPDDDPDWGFEDEEAEPEQGDFWLDSDDEEDAL